MTTQFQAIRKILDLAAQDGRVEQAIEELEKFAMLRACDFLKYTEHCMEPKDWVNEDGSFKSLTEVYEQYKANSKSI